MATANEEKKPDIKLMNHATFVTSPIASMENNLPNNKVMGVPGVCGTCSLKAAARVSEQSQSEAVGSRVSK